MKRRELFSSLFFDSPNQKKEADIIRPPYYKNEDSFYKECINCVDKPCITFCEENIIINSDDNTPLINFQNGGCTYCDECAKNCTGDVLQIEYKKNINYNIEIDILKCVSWNNTMCFSCKDPCLDDAIEFLGIFKPSILGDKCTSCGFCINVCPSDAIKLIKKVD